MTGILIELLTLIVSLIVLVKGSDFFVEYAAKLAKRLGISELVIGLTLVSVGTSLPELSSSVTASLYNAGDLAIGNIVGSNIANICLIIGFSAIIASIKFNKKLFTREGLMLMSSAVLFFIFASDNQVSRIEGIGLLVFFFSYIAYLFKEKIEFKKLLRIESYVDQVLRLRGFISLKNYKQMAQAGLDTLSRKRNINQMYSSVRASIIGDIIIITISCIALILGSKYLVISAVTIADALRISSQIIGLSVIAVGTSLPELMVSITSLKKGFNEILVGNIIGSNVANILLIGGLAAIISPLPIDKLATITIPIMIGASVLFLLFARTDWEIKRTEGIMLLGIYAAFIAFLVRMVF